MAEEILHESPLDDEVYCYTTFANKEYHTIGIHPLMKFLVCKIPFMIEMCIGEIKFRSITNNPICMIPVYSDHITKFATKLDKIDLYPSGAEPPNGIRYLDVPMVFNVDVEPYFSHKIEDGLLYKREDNVWKLFPL